LVLFDVALVQYQADRFPLDHGLGERFGVFAKALDGFLRMDSLRSVDANQANLFVGVKNNRVAIDDAHDFSKLRRPKRLSDDGFAVDSGASKEQRGGQQARRKDSV
jgi:hypothetical protein